MVRTARDPKLFEAVVSVCRVGGRTGVCHHPLPPTFSLTSLWMAWYDSMCKCRTFLSIIGGVVAGIFGFTGLKGFVFYFLLMAVSSLGLMAKARFSIHSYFDPWNGVLLDGFLGGLMSFVLFWTFAYDIVHIF